MNKMENWGKIIVPITLLMWSIIIITAVIAFVTEFMKMIK